MMLDVERHSEKLFLEATPSCAAGLLIWLIPLQYQRLAKPMKRGIAEGIVKPLPLTTFPMQLSEEAFRQLTKGSSNTS